MSGGDSNITTRAPKAASVRAMTSAYGRRIPLVYGRGRVQANVIYYVDFKAIENKTKTKSGGKGGGGGVTQTNINYTYTVCTLMALCEGVINDIGLLWIGKQKGSLDEWGFTGFHGTDTQIALGYITTNHPSEAIPYRNTAYIANSALNLGDDPSISNVNVEVYGRYSGEDITTTEERYTTVSDSIPASPFQVTVTPPYSGVWSASLAVQVDQFGDNYYTPMTLVGSSPGLNEYMVSGGVYTFNAGNEGNAIIIDYQYETGTGDANPGNVIQDLITDPKSCLGLSITLTGLDDVRTYCQAMEVYVSPVYTEAKPANEMIKTLCEISNTAVYFSENAVKFVPLYDKVVTNGAITYTPNLTPAYDLTTDDILDDGTITIIRKAQDDSYNRVNVNYQNRAIDYNDDVQSAFDQSSIEQFGLRPMADLNYPEIVDSEVARLVGQQAIQRSNTVKNIYEFRLGWQYARLEPTDILTLTDPALGLNLKPVRILRVDEDDDGIFISAEEMQIGSLSPAKYTTQDSDGYLVDYNAPPGNTNEPFIFDAPTSLAGAPEIWIAASGADEINWGGCNVWISEDNATYKVAGIISGPARHGTTTALLSGSFSGDDIDQDNTLKIALTNTTQTMDSGTTQAALDYETLMIVTGSSGNELMAYRDATLTGAGAYDLEYLPRGLYGSNIMSHATNSKFARLDNMIFKYAYDPEIFMGRTMYLKFQSFNVYGAAYQDLSALPAYTHEIIGAPIGTVTGLALVQPFTGDTAKAEWLPVRGAKSYTVEIRNLAGSTTYRSISTVDTFYEYNWQDSKADGGPYRDIRFYVKAVSDSGQGNFSFVNAQNPVPAALTGIALTGGFGAIFAEWGASPETDVLGYQVWMSTSSGFTPGSGNLLYDGTDNKITTRTLPAGLGGGAVAAGVTYYFRMAAYDKFGNTSLNISSEISVVPLAIAAGISPGEITATMIAAGAVDMTKFASGIRPPRVVTSLPTIDGTIYKNQDTVTLTTNGKLYRAVSGVWTAEIPAADVSGQLTNAQIADLASTKITGQLTNSQIADLAATKISGQLTNAQIADIAAAKVTGTLTNSQIADLAATKITGQITTTQISDNAISTPKLAAGSVVAGKIAADAVTANEIAANAVTSAKINAGAVVAGKIAAGAVTAGTIAANAVTATEISAGSITTGKIAAGAVTASEIAANAVTATQINAGAVTTAKIAAGAVTASEIAASTITATQLAAGAVTTAKLAAGAVTANEIAANTITAAKIAAGAIGATQIAANAITADKLFVSKLGTIINDDPNFADSTAWDFTGGAAISSTTSNITGAVANTFAIGVNQNCTAISKRFYPIDSTKTYRVSINALGTIDLNGNHDTRSVEYGILGYNSAGTLINNLLYYMTAPEEVFQSANFWVGVGGETINSTVTQFKMYARMRTSEDGDGDQIHYIQNFRIELLSDGTLIQDGAISTNKVAANAITAGKIAANTITASQIAAGTITATQIASGTITATQISSGTITATQIASSTITTDKIVVGAVTAESHFASSSTSTVGATSTKAIELSLGSFTSTGVQSNIVASCEMDLGGDFSSSTGLNSATAFVDVDVYLKVDGSNVVTRSVTASVIRVGSTYFAFVPFSFVYRNTFSAGSHSVSVRFEAIFLTSAGGSQNQSSTTECTLRANCLVQENKV